MTTIDAGVKTPKKQKISQLRRLLWHVNRTDLGWVLKAALTGLQLPSRAKRIALLKQLPVKPEWSEASRKLTEEGYVDVSTIVERRLAEAVAAVADAKM